jgi:hypothetical protein
MKPLLIPEFLAEDSAVQVAEKQLPLKMKDQISLLETEEDPVEFSAGSFREVHQTPAIPRWGINE